jgi:DNA polymerase III subunit beta
MKFTCALSDLQKALNVTSRAISAQQALPILSNVLLKAEGKTCTLSATDLELSITTSLPATIENEGGITIPAKAIVNFAQYNSDSEVTLEVLNGTQLKCTSAKTKTIISGEVATDYPTITPITKEHSFNLPVQATTEALHKVNFSTAKTTLRPVLSGVYCVLKHNTATLVATDSYRLSEYTIPLNGNTKEAECIIPAKVLEEVKNILGTYAKQDTPAKEDESINNLPELQVALSSQQIEFSINNITLLSRLIDGKFPDYKQIIPKEHTTTIGIPMVEFATILKRMHFFAKEMNNNITFSVNEEGLHLSTMPTQAGKDETTINVEFTGQPTKIALSSLYLLDFLSHIKCETITLSLTDSMHPAVFTLPALNEYLHLIMPLRLQEEIQS